MARGGAEGALRPRGRGLKPTAAVVPVKVTAYVLLDRLKGTINKKTKIAFASASLERKWAVRTGLAQICQQVPKDDANKITRGHVELIYLVTNNTKQSKISPFHNWHQQLMRCSTYETLMLRHNGICQHCVFIWPFYLSQKNWGWGGVRSEAISKRNVNLPADIAGAVGPAHKSSGLTMTSFSKCVTDTHNTRV